MGGCLASSDGEKNPAPTVQAAQFNHCSVGNVDLRLRRSLGSLGNSKRFPQHLTQKEGRLLTGMTASEYELATIKMPSVIHVQQASNQSKLFT